MTIVGTRPELIKMCRVIERFDEHTEHVLVHTGQNYDYELNQVFFDDLGIRKPDRFLEAAGPTAAATIARVIERADAALAEEQPDALLIYGDTNSCLAVIAAKRRKIPVFHMEAGNRCFDQRVPEEINRKIVDHLSDINITITEHARRYLLAENLPPDRVFVFGSHLPEVFDTFREQIDASPVLANAALFDGLPPALLITAGYDPLGDEGLELGEKISGGGAEVEDARFEGQIHGFLTMGALIGETEQALDRIAGFLKRHNG
jgi:UDP-N-acetylglucosamine 2-epimerase (non-hydrolysing)